MLKTVKDFNFKGKRVIIRCDFNVPLKRGKVLDDFKIKRSLKTINHLKKQGAQIVILSHLGRPKRKKKSCSLRSIGLKLSELLNSKVVFRAKCCGKRAQKAAQQLKKGEVLLLENLRFEKGEEANDKEFVQELKKLGSSYVGEAFSVSHRNHASVVSLPRVMPHCIGFDFEEELKFLSQLNQNPKKPYAVIIGGSKVESKMPAVKRFLKKADHVLLGGQIANVILSLKGICIGRHIFNGRIKEVTSGFSLTDPRMHLPFDVVAVSGEVIREAGPASVRKEEDILDIGAETREAFSDIIKESKTIFWSGVLGKVEEEKFSLGTEKVMQAIVDNKRALKVAGGGDTIAFIRKHSKEQSFSFLSTGGSAALAFLAGQKLPGIEALK